MTVRQQRTWIQTYRELSCRQQSGSRVKALAHVSPVTWIQSAEPTMEGENQLPKGVLWHLHLCYVWHVPLLLILGANSGLYGFKASVVLIELSPCLLCKNPSQPSKSTQIVSCASWISDQTAINHRVFLRRKVCPWSRLTFCLVMSKSPTEYLSQLRKARTV